MYDSKGKSQKEPLYNSIPTKIHRSLVTSSSTTEEVVDEMLEKLPLRVLVEE